VEGLKAIFNKSDKDHIVDTVPIHHCEPSSISVNTLESSPELRDKLITQLHEAKNSMKEGDKFTMSFSKYYIEDLFKEKNTSEESDVFKSPRPSKRFINVPESDSFKNKITRGKVLYSF
jgi:hypothetical protein